MKLILKAGLAVLVFIMSPSLYAFDFGARISLGLSSGAGQSWNSRLDDAGSRSYSDVLSTAGAGVFAEFELSRTFYFSPEISLVLNRGVKMSDGSGNSISTIARGALEMILPVSLEYPVTKGTALRLTGGLQLFFSPDLKEEIRIGGSEEHNDLENKSILSAGVVLGGGVVFRKDKKVSWITDIRIKLPFTDSIGYSAADGSSVHLKTIELLAGAGVRF